MLHVTVDSDPALDFHAALQNRLTPHTTSKLCFAVVSEVVLSLSILILESCGTLNVSLQFEVCPTCTMYPTHEMSQMDAFSPQEDGQRDWMKKFVSSFSPTEHDRNSHKYRAVCRSPSRPAGQYYERCREETHCVREPAGKVHPSTWHKGRRQGTAKGRPHSSRRLRTRWLPDKISCDAMKHTTRSDPAHHNKNARCNNAVYVNTES